jgi:glutamate synthase domain-containing protein 3
MGGVAVFQQFQQGIGKAIHGGGVFTLGIDNGAGHKREMRAIDQSHAVEKIEYVCHVRTQARIPDFRKSEIRKSAPDRLKVDTRKEEVFFTAIQAE